jgi:hypothetical protein
MSESEMNITSDNTSSNRRPQNLVEGHNPENIMWKRTPLRESALQRVFNHVLELPVPTEFEDLLKRMDAC